MTEKVEHRNMALPPPWEVSEDQLTDEVRHDAKVLAWVDSFYLNAMRITAAGVLKVEGSLDKAANALWYAGYKLPAGYFDDEELAFTGEDGHAYEYDPMDEEALQLYVEKDRENIEKAAESIGFRLAMTGQLMDQTEG